VRPRMAGNDLWLGLWAKIFGGGDRSLHCLYVYYLGEGENGMAHINQLMILDRDLDI